MLERLSGPTKPFDIELLILQIVLRHATWNFNKWSPDSKRIRPFNYLKVLVLRVFRWPIMLRILKLAISLGFSKWILLATALQNCSLCLLCSIHLPAENGLLATGNILNIFRYFNIKLLEPDFDWSDSKNINRRSGSDPGQVGMYFYSMDACCMRLLWSPAILLLRPHNNADIKKENGNEYFSPFTTLKSPHNHRLWINIYCQKQILWITE